MITSSTPASLPKSTTRSAPCVSQMKSEVSKARQVTSTAAIPRGQRNLLGSFVQWVKSPQQRGEVIHTKRKIAISPAEQHAVDPGQASDSDEDIFWGPDGEPLAIHLPSDDENVNEGASDEEKEGPCYPAEAMATTPERLVEEEAQIRLIAEKTAIELLRNLGEAQVDEQHQQAKAVAPTVQNPPYTQKFGNIQ